MWKNRFGSKYALHNREMMINKKYQYIMKHLACLFFKKYIYVTIAGYRNILQLSYEYCRTLLSLKATRTIFQLTK